MAAPDLTTDLAHLLAHKWYRDELGRVPDTKEHAERVRIIREQGLFAAFTGIYDSDEAKRFRKTTGRKV